MYTANRSCTRTFTMHDCLPLRLRIDTFRRGEREGLSLLVDEVATGLHNVSQQHVYKIVLLLDNLLFGRGLEERGRVTNPGQRR